MDCGAFVLAATLPAALTLAPTRFFSPPARMASKTVYSAPLHRARNGYKVKSVAALQTLFGGRPHRMRVEADQGIALSAKTVGELRKLREWPANLAITTPPEPDPE